MTLSPAVDGFVTLKRALGAVFTVAARVLQSCVPAVGDIPVTAVYLTMTVDLLGEASRRFEQYATPAEEPSRD